MEDVIQIWRPKKLAQLLDVSDADLNEAIEQKDRFCREYTLHDPRPGGKDRDVLSVTGKLRLVQERFYKRVLLRHLRPSEYSFGGVAGRSIKQNAAVHLGNRFLFVADISNFYPSISHQRVLRLFRKRFGWPRDVSSLCTKLCTYDYHLALGLVTSPILADQILKPVDRQMAKACERYHVRYTRFVDDITLSAAFDIADTPLGGVIRGVLEQNGFHVKERKTLAGPADDPRICVTKLRLKRDHLDVRREYVDSIIAQIQTARDVAAGKVPSAPYYPRASVQGRLQFVLWINPARRDLVKQFRSVDWKRADDATRVAGLIIPKPRLIPRDQSVGLLRGQDVGFRTDHQA